MPEPSNDSLKVTAGVTTGNGAEAEEARKNMALRGPERSTLDILEGRQGGMGGPEAELMGLPKGEASPGKESA